MTRSTRLATWLAVALLPACDTGPPPVTEGYAVTDDSVRIYYRVVGTGDETVLVPVASLHGTRLDRWALGRRIVLYDNRGRARSDSVPAGKISLDHQFRDLEAVRRAVAAERVALIGWSGLGLPRARHGDRPPARDPRRAGQHFS